jgi:hypothetical protein
VQLCYARSDLYVGKHDLRGPGWLNKLGIWVT